MPGSAGSPVDSGDEYHPAPRRRRRAPARQRSLRTGRHQQPHPGPRQRRAGGRGNLPRAQARKRRIAKRIALGLDRDLAGPGEVEVGRLHLGAVEAEITLEARQAVGVAGRRQREIDPTATALRECLANPAIADEEEGTRQRIEDTLKFIEIMSSLADEMLRYKPETLMKTLGVSARISQAIRRKE